MKTFILIACGLGRSMRSRAAAAVLLAVFSGARSGSADDTWDGGPNSGTPEWSAGTNWADNSAPSKTAGGVITFNNTGLGQTNLVDDDWALTTLKYENTLSQSHTTVVAAGKTLIVAGGFLAAGDSRTNTLVAIRGGTVQLGTSGAAADLRVAVAAASGYTNTRLSLTGTFNAQNLSNLWVGRQTGVGSGASQEGQADLSGASIWSGASANTLKCSGSLVVGGGRGRSPTGLLKLPPALTEIEADTIELGSGNGAYMGQGSLDFGSGSQLKKLTARSALHLGQDGSATLVGWPTNVEVAVGQVSASAPMTVGCSQGATGCRGSLALTNGSFTAYLSSLKVGCNSGTTSGTNFPGLLDLAETTVFIGSSNSVLVPEWRIGGEGGRHPNGIVKLPSAITNIAAGILELGAGNGTYLGLGTLDLGTNSQLQSLTVSNEFTLGYAGRAYLTGFPTNVAVEIGLPDRLAPVTIGCGTGAGSYGSFAPTNCRVRMYASTLRIGCNFGAVGTAGTISGLLDVQSSQLQVGPASNAVSVSELLVGGGGGRYGYGALKLPPSITNIAVGVFELGRGTGTQSGEGTLDLGANSQLRGLTVTNEFSVGNPGKAYVLGFPANVQLRIGSPSRYVPVAMGCSEGGSSAGSLTLTGGRAEIFTSSLRIGCNSAAVGSAGTITGRLDMGAAEVQIGPVPDSVMVPELRIGGGGGRYGNGTLLLPPSITNITVDIFDLGSGQGGQSGAGTLDLGVNSQLKTLTASNEFSMGAAGKAYLTGLPEGVAVRIGSPGRDVPLRLGYSGGDAGIATLAVTNGSFTAYSSLLYIGCNNNPVGGALGGIRGELDLATSAVQIGDTPNEIRLAELRLGGGGGRYGNGTLKMPGTVTNFTVGVLEIAAGSPLQAAAGILDFGVGSGLKTLTISNELTLGVIGAAILTNWPENVQVRIGLTNNAAKLTVGVAVNAYGNAELALPGGSRLSAYLSTADIGISTGYYSVPGAIGRLNLTNAAVDAFVVTGAMNIGSSAATANTNGQGFVFLPACEATIGDRLNVGDTHSGSKGLLVLSGTRVRVANGIGIHPTGIVSNRLTGTAGGLDLLSSDTNNLSIAEGGGMVLVFAADPVGRDSTYWGLRMRGNAIGYFQSLTSAPARVTCDVSALSAGNRQAFGVYYETRSDTTFLGLPAIARGTVILIR